MPDYTKGLSYKTKHEQWYNKALEAPHKEEEDPNTKKKLSYDILRETHDDALSPALAKLKGARYKTYATGLSKLADSFIEYKKKAGIGTGEAFREAHELEQLLTALLRSQNQEFSHDAAYQLLKSEGITGVMTKLLDIYKNQDLRKFTSHRIREALPKDLKYDDHLGIAHYHASRHPTEKYTKRRLAGKY